jgi:N-methylhydantoinase A
MPTDAALRALFDGLEAEGRTRMAGWHDGDVAARRSADMRYGEQVFEVAVPLDALDWAAPGLGDRIRAAFHARHRELFTYDLPEEEVVLVNARLAVVGLLPRHAAAGRAGAAAAAPIAERPIRLDGATVTVPVHDFEALAPGQALAGPAIVESATTTVLLRPGDAARMDARGWLEIAVPLAG